MIKRMGDYSFAPIAATGTGYDDDDSIAHRWKFHLSIHPLIPPMRSWKMSRSPFIPYKWTMKMSISPLYVHIAFIELAVQWANHPFKNLPYTLQSTTFSPTNLAIITWPYVCLIYQIIFNLASPVNLEFDINFTANNHLLVGWPWTLW